MVWLRVPGTSKGYGHFVQGMCVRKAVADANYVIVISRSTQDELIQTLGVPREKTKLVYPGVAERYRPQDQAKAAEYISRKYGVPLRYMATAGTVEPRKNLRLLVERLRILKLNRQLHCPLLGVAASCH